MIVLLAKVAFALVFIAVAYVLYGFVHRYRQSSLKFLKGPTSKSLLFGADYDIMHQKEIGLLENKWFKEYGTAFRATTYYSEDMLIVADPQALQYICHTSGYRFPKPQDFYQVAGFLMGRGLVTVEGEVHNRQRRALNPAFSLKQLRQFLELFQRSTAKLVTNWHDEFSDFSNGGSVINVTDWLPKITLDVIGESAFNYKFEALDGHENELGNVFRDMFLDSRIYPRKRQLLYRAFRHTLPSSVANFLLQFPTKEEKRFLGFLNASKRTAKPIFEKASIESKATEDSNEGKDILSILVRSNQELDPKKSLDNDEVLSQMATIILAGHETTASTSAWILYGLTKHPKDQAKLSQEIREMRERIGDRDPNPQDLDSMPFLNAVIKEALRMYPILQNITREAQSDDVIPLEFPVANVSGDEISQIPVRKGTRVTLSLGCYNRLPQVWGDDADEWKPERFINMPKKNTNLGVYANLMTFSAGIRGCIGWRFAVMELQAIIFGLLEKFEFCPPASGELDEIQAVPVGGAVPMKKGKWEEGRQMPLLIRARK
ncbi:cytochrome P450 [Gymnopus androsaceus JB14]|uniref:Cytochrome P450 n=1 Tax=Gymnopus androsaceus JB14 TaxID=1447944 RepID=A0A6A4H9J6_9AGAR|nr:cytochrome P450 [Gymnopus androsaceus JB14]